MSKPSYQDQHLDLMIEMAFAQLDAEEIDQLINEPDPMLTPEEEARADRVFLSALDRSSKLEKKEKRGKRKNKVFTGLRYAAAAIAAIFILALIALPITFVASAEFRQTVMKLFVEIDENRGEAHFSFRPEDQPTELPYITKMPEGWKGKYYPAYIPSGFSITEYDDIFHSIEWQNDAEARIIYSEYDENITSVSGTDGAEITSILIHGNDATLIDGYTDNVHCVTIVWAEEDRWFDLIFYGMDTSEAIRIAESVREL